MTPTPVSSTEIRERIGRGEPIHELVPRSVQQEIERSGLYRED
jgi:nicotinic acid mononucleotide adenylyltransferase